MVTHGKNTNVQDHKKAQQQQHAKQKKVKKRLLIAVIILIIVVAIGLFVTSMQQSSVIDTSSFEQLSLTAISETDHVKGSENASILIVEYSDFQCPACASYEPVIAKLIEEHGDIVQVVYRHFPLETIHKNARIAAQASEAAGLQGQFWEMHDILFERQSEWSSKINPKSDFISYATELGLDVTQFKKDIDAQYPASIVQHNLDDANKLTLRGTPSFFINGTPLKITSYDQLVGIVERFENQ